jgi:hypothetical protein
VLVNHLTNALESLPEGKLQEIEVVSIVGRGSTFRVKLPPALSADFSVAHPSAEMARERPN